jgi:enoyl-CoA hydratase
MSDQVVKSEVRADGVGVLTLARPDRLNAISAAVAERIAEVAASFRLDESVRAIVVAGEGKVFCAGADIAEFSELENPPAFAAFLGRLTRAFDILASCPKPSVAALHGAALGGGLELALACDLRIAEEGTRLGVPEIKLGLLPGAAGTVRLPRLVPEPVARRMLLTGEPIPAEEALRLGLLSGLVPPGSAFQAAGDLAARLAALPPLALAAAKRLLAPGVGLPEAAAVDLERQTVSMLFGTEDRVEGVTAFLEKRSPSFRGR